jgi:hypothetical protein
MDPITTAIIAALANLSTNAIKDGYEALKTILKKKFSDKRDLLNAVETLEKRPDSAARKATVQEEIALAKVNDDPDVLPLAQELLNRVHGLSGGQEIISQTQTNTVSGVNVSGGGDFVFKPVQAGKER